MQYTQTNKDYHDGGKDAEQERAQDILFDTFHEIFTGQCHNVYPLLVLLRLRIY